MAINDISPYRPNQPVSKPLLKTLRDQVIREILSYLDYKDFVNFTMTCLKFKMFLEDPYIQVNLPKKVGTYTLDHSTNLIEEIFVNQYINQKALAATITTDQPDLLHIFHRDNKNILYSYQQNVIVASRLVPWHSQPVRRDSWTVEFSITKATAFEDVFLVGSKVGLQLLSKKTLPNTVYDRHQEIYCAWHYFRRSSYISELAILNKGLNFLCILDRSEVLVFNESLQVICNYRTEYYISAFDVPCNLERNFLIGHSSGGVFLYKAYQSKSQAIEILAHNNDLAGPIKKIRSIRIEKHERYDDLVLSLTVNGRLFIKDLDYPKEVEDFEFKHNYLFVVNNYVVSMVDLSDFPYLYTVMVFKLGRIVCCLPLNNKLLTIEEKKDELVCNLHLYSNGEQVGSYPLGMQRLREVRHYNDLIISHGDKVETYVDELTGLVFPLEDEATRLTNIIYYYRPIPIWDQS